MKKPLIALAAFVLGLAISSCQIQTCPTYSKNDAKPAKEQRDIDA